MDQSRLLDAIPNSPNLRIDAAAKATNVSGQACCRPGPCHFTRRRALRRPGATVWHRLVLVAPSRGLRCCCGPGELEITLLLASRRKIACHPAAEERPDQRLHRQADHPDPIRPARCDRGCVARVNQSARPARGTGRDRDVRTVFPPTRVRDDGCRSG